MSLADKLDRVLTRAEEIRHLLATAEGTQFGALSKELSDLEPLVEKVAALRAATIHLLLRLALPFRLAQLLAAAAGRLRHSSHPHDGQLREHALQHLHPFSFGLLIGQGRLVPHSPPAVLHHCVVKKPPYQ